ncbi:RRXRR domain-containing protein [Deinococcus alpinitundrae]
MHNRVFVLNSDRRPLMPCTAKRAQKMLDSGVTAARHWRRC